MRANGRRAREATELFEASLATGIGQALAGWAAEYTHSLLESDPELRKRLRQNWLFIFEHIARDLRETERPKRRRARRAVRHVRSR
jgi:ribosomal protein S9